MNPKTVSPHAKAIQLRFFAALDDIIKSGKLKGLKPFCDKYGLHRSKYSKVRTYLINDADDRLYRLIDFEALYYIVSDYNISSDWLLKGTGPMYNTKGIATADLKRNKVKVH